MKKIAIMSLGLLFLTAMIFNFVLNQQLERVSDIVLSDVVAQAGGDGDDNGNGTKEGSGGDLHFQKYECPPGSTYHQYSICEEGGALNPCNQLGERTGSCNY